MELHFGCFYGSGNFSFSGRGKFVGSTDFALRCWMGNGSSDGELRAI